MMPELTEADRKRRSELFRRQLRSDLLAGRADRWEISTPRDELEKFRFFARKIESFIDEAETSEVESLRESVKHLSQDEQDEFFAWHYPVHWDDIFRSTIRGSVVVSLASFLETFLTRQCYRTAVLMQSEAPSFRSDTLKVARKFLEVTGGFQKPCWPEWNEIGLFFKIRNEIVHSPAFGTVSKRKEEIEKFCKDHNGIRLHHGVVEIEPEFLEYIINQLISFVNQLESEFTLLCERTRNLERV